MQPTTSAEPGPGVPSDFDQTVFGFAGRFIQDDFHNAFVPFADNYEDQFVLGAGYQRFFYQPAPGNQLGLEAGASLRLGMGATAEVWGGAVWQNDGVVLGKVRMSPAFTFGLSAVTGSHGTEAAREEDEGGSASVLFYLGPELDFSLVDHPELQLFWRVHHRSAAWNTCCNMAGSANANTIGIRYRF